jgi:hypothetical protein
LTGLTVTVVVTVLPSSTVKVLGAIDKVKLGCGKVTINLIVAA